MLSRFGVRKETVVSIFLYVLALGSTPLHALSIVSVSFENHINLPLPVSIGAEENLPVNVTYRESVTDFLLTVNSNSLFDPDEDLTFDITQGALWNISLTFSYDNALFEDESVLAVQGTAFHNVAPSGPDHLGDAEAGDSIEINFPPFSLEEHRENEDWVSHQIVLNNSASALHRAIPHLDVYSPNRLRITRSALDIDELHSFSYRLAGRHIPEPPGWSLFLIGLAGLIKMRTQR